MFQLGLMVFVCDWIGFSDDLTNRNDDLMGLRAGLTNRHDDLMVVSWDLLLYWTNDKGPIELDIVLMSSTIGIFDMIFWWVL